MTASRKSTSVGERACSSDLGTADAREASDEGVFGMKGFAGDDVWEGLKPNMDDYKRVAAFFTRRDKHVILLI